MKLAPQCKVKVNRRFSSDFSIAENPPIRNVRGSLAARVGRGKGARQMSTRYTISQLARAADLPTTTLRFYERAGLLAAADRSAGNYRLYTDQSLARLRFIRAAQAIGFTLDDVRTLLGSGEQTSPSCCDVQALIEERLDDIDRRLKDLRHVQRVLRSALQNCVAEEWAGRCHVLETLQSRP